MSYLDLLPRRMRGGYLTRLRTVIALLGVLLSLILVFDGLVLLSFDASLSEIFDTALASMSSFPKDRAAAIAAREANLTSVALDSFRAVGDATAEAAAAAPDGIRFESFALDVDPEKIVIRGFASSVQEVLNFKAALEATDRFTPSSVTFSDLQADGSARFIIEADVELTRI